MNDEQKEEVLSRVSVIDGDSGPTVRIDKKDIKYLKVDIFENTGLGFLLAMVAGGILFVILDQTIGSENILPLLISAAVILLGTVYSLIHFLRTDNETMPYYVCVKGIKYKAWREGAKEKDITEGGIKSIHLQFYKGSEDTSTRELKLESTKEGEIYKTNWLNKEEVKILTDYFRKHKIEVRK